MALLELGLSGWNCKFSFVVAMRVVIEFLVGFGCLCSVVFLAEFELLLRIFCSLISFGLKSSSFEVVVMGFVCSPFECRKLMCCFCSWVVLLVICWPFEFRLLVVPSIRWW